MGEFRDRMERDLQIRGFSPLTQKCYLARMKAMVRFFMRPPDELTLEDVNAYQLYLTRDRKVGWSTFNQSVCAIRFFYGVTLNRDWDIRHIPYQKTGRKLPVVLSCEEVSELFQAVTNIKHRAILMTAYSGGLRVAYRRLRTYASATLTVSA
jgi:integrase/recombinase XerD